MHEPLCQADTIRVGARSRAAAALVNDAILRLDENTTLRLINVQEEEEESSFLGLIKGMFASFSRRPRTLTAETPYLNATIEGTEFAVRVVDDRAQVTVFEGQVAAANDFGRLTLAEGESAEARAGQAPEPRVVVRPRDAVQWALYYPPVLAALGGQADQGPAEAPASLREAIRLGARNDYPGAFEQLDRVAQAARGPLFHVYRAGLLLNVGRVDEARADIDRALTADPDFGVAYALRAVINIVQNRKDEALADARRATELSPQSAAAKIALSFAQQAHFRLEDARATMLQAVEENPDDALARARLAELWLATGYRGRALETAEQAVDLAPDVGRTQVVLGFAALSRIDTETARQAFGRAIELRSSDPLPWLGQGLAKIRESDLEAGRSDIEVAVGLDSSNALLRAYLGKAYFEETRAPLDAEQFALAKNLDPLDPTAYLYDAIRKQSENNPGGALDDLQASIERNDNRAVYRGRLQLDEDRAARGTSLARIYDDLGFHELGLNEASTSLALDPSNASAHRFLSDTYRGLRRREIARVSELVQAQLLQDVNINPVQPSISETNLNIITGGGPAEAGFNEFTPLFERNGLQVNLTGNVGNNDSGGGEGVVSAIHDWLSLSAGAFHFETDGWRPNHDIEHDIQNVFAQAAVTPELNIQAELRLRQSEEGDLDFNFNPNDFSSAQDRDLNQDIARGGLRYSPTPNSDILLSFVYSDVNDDVIDSSTTPFGFIATSALGGEDGYQAEAQYIYQQNRFNIVAGAAFGEIERNVDLLAQPVIPGLPPFAQPPPLLDQETSEDFDHLRGYVYGNVNFPDPVTWTLGVSYDDFDAPQFTVEKVNPKVGVRWNVTDDIVFRGAVSQTVKPLLTNNRTLEPTQVAGFNQLFDDLNATRSLRYGVGLDWQATSDLFVGAEATLRDLEVPFVSGSAGRFTDHQEQTHGAYLYWNPVTEVALGAKFVYDRFNADSSPLTQDVVPERLETISVPLSARYFHRSGFFAGLTGTFVDQEVRRANNHQLGLAEGDDSFFVVDASVGYRFPNRLGLISLQVMNLFDNEFRFQDDSFREFQDAPSIGPYIPDRTIRAQIAFSW